MKMINVVIVEDDPMVMEIHRRFVATMEDFVIIGTAENGLEALDILKKEVVHLVILDIFMPELDGIDTLYSLRKAHSKVDIIVVSAAAEPEIVHRVITYGAFDYIIKPFTLERFRAALQAYRDFFSSMRTQTDDFSQKEIDKMMSRKSHNVVRSSLPKGLAENTLQIVQKILLESNVEMSADEVAEKANISRVTARRYLEYLVSAGEASIHSVARNIGRPVNKYRSFKY